MTDLTDLLDRAGDPDDNTVDARADLARARTAWQRRRRIRSLAAAGSLVAVGVLAVGVAGSGVLDRAPQHDSAVVDDPAPTTRSPWWRRPWKRAPTRSASSPRAGRFRESGPPP